MKRDKPSYLNFERKKYFWKRNIDYRKHPELYRIGKGEQGVLICEPYKSLLLKHWRFRTPELAEVSSQKIYRMFESFLRKKDFVGADMARKFLQMGYTHAKRYANYKGGLKYDKKKNYTLMPRKVILVKKKVCASSIEDGKKHYHILLILN